MAFDRNEAADVAFGHRPVLLEVKQKERDRER